MKLTFIGEWLAAFLLLMARGPAFGQASQPPVPPFAAKGAFIAIVVTDLDASVQWYQSNLGLRVIKSGRSARVPAQTVVLGGHGMFIELIHHDGKPQRRLDNEASVPRLIKAGMILSGQDFEALAKYFGQRDIEAEIFADKEMKARSFLIRDGEGNLIQFFTL